VTARKISTGDDSRATSVATRRKAACSSASSARDARASAFEIAVATSSVKTLSLVSAPSGIGAVRVAGTAITPQVTSSTTIGAAIAPTIPAFRAASATVPGSPE
jgi:hypothetical protein